MQQLGHKEHTLAGVGDAEMLTVAVVAAKYIQNHHLELVSEYLVTVLPHKHEQFRLRDTPEYRLLPGRRLY